jgi:tetratricopeptide (TPR) repeat protein
VVTAFMIRSTLRNPSWYDSFTAMNTLALEHPESWRSHRSRAEGLVRAGELDAALEEYEEALALVPLDYSLLSEAGEANMRQRRWLRAEDLLTTAVATDPDRPTAYRLLAQLYLVTGDGRNAHGTALAGLARWGTDRQLWALVSESYVAKGDLLAAVRAREAALGADPSSEWDRNRLAELLQAVATSGDSR